MNAVFSVVLGELHQELKADRQESPHDEVPIKAAAIIGENEEKVHTLRRAEAQYIAAEIRRMLDEKMQIFDKQNSAAFAPFGRATSLYCRTPSAAGDLRRRTPNSADSRREYRRRKPARNANGQGRNGGAHVRG